MPSNILCSLRSEVLGKGIFADLTPTPGKLYSGNNAPTSHFHQI